MAFRSSAMRTAIPALAGAVAGLLGASLLVGFRANSEVKKPPVEAQGDAQVRKLEATVVPPHPLETPRPVAGTPTTAPAEKSAPSVDSPPPDALEEKRQDRRFRDISEFHTKLLMHAQEPVDESWANKMQPLVSAGLEEAARSAKLGVEVANVSCRSVSCVADLRWPSVEQASREYDNLVAISDIPCARTITLEDAPSGGGDYSAKMFMDCTDSKLGTVENNHRN